MWRFVKTGAIPSFMYILVSVAFVLLMLSLKHFPIHTRRSTNPTTFRSFGIKYYAFVTVVIITIIIIIIIIPERSIRVNFIEFGTNFPHRPDGSETQPALTQCVSGALSLQYNYLGMKLMSYIYLVKSLRNNGGALPVHSSSRERSA
jgi:hypothetical protein